VKRRRSARPNLRRLCGAYLNADFDVFGPRPEDAVAAFSAAASAEVRAATRAEIADFLAAHPTEAGRRRALARMRFGVALPAFGFRDAGALLERAASLLARPPR
jgi:hypothetical protein